MWGSRDTIILRELRVARCRDVAGNLHDPNCAGFKVLADVWSGPFDWTTRYADLPSGVQWLGISRLRGVHCTDTHNMFHDHAVTAGY